MSALDRVTERLAVSVFFVFDSTVFTDILRPYFEKSCS
jgi:hypothetical protein